MKFAVAYKIAGSVCSGRIMLVQIGTDGAEGREGNGRGGVN